MKYIVNLTHSRTGSGKVRTVNAEDVKEADEIMRQRYPNYEVGRITADDSGSLRKLYRIMKEAERES